MVGLLIFEYMYDRSDIQVLNDWINNYMLQAFTGFTPHVTDKAPCDRTTLVKFRKRIGIDGVRVILNESINIHGKKALADLAKIGIIDSTVQEKYTAFPTDLDLALKTIKNIRSIAKKTEVRFRQNYGKQYVN
jgi:IS5 family transposase